MGAISKFIVESEERNRAANSIKMRFIAAMENEGLINNKLAVEMSNYLIVLTPKGFFGKWFDKMMGRKDDGVYIDVMKPCLIPAQENKER